MTRILGIRFSNTHTASFAVVPGVRRFLVERQFVPVAAACYAVAKDQYNHTHYIRWMHERKSKPPKLPTKLKF